jgi:hypothetical protein
VLTSSGKNSAQVDGSGGHGFRVVLSSDISLLLILLLLFGASFLTAGFLT